MFALTQNTNAQIDPSSDLFQSITKADSLLFQEGFNKCELEQVEDIISGDFEFYHDENGIQNRAEFFEGFKTSICSSPERKPLRKLVSGSSEVFRLKNNGQTYGVIQKGVHEFYIKEPNTKPRLTSTGKFTHLWILEEDNWKLKRGLSYEHETPPEIGDAFKANFPQPLFDTDKGINKLLKQHTIPSLGIGYIDGGKLQQIRVFGEQEAGIPASYNTIYKVASLTKPVTALVTLKLIDAGELGLDETVYQYYIDEDLEGSPQLRQLTIRHLLSHQSGFPNWRYLTDSGKLRFEFEPGDRFQYSGEGFEYLRKVLETKFNKPLEELAEELIFDPLGMNDTHFYWSEEINESRYALEHDEEGKALSINKNKEANGAANLMTTVKDYATFMAYVLNGAELPKKLYTQMISKQASVKEGVDFGLGWKIFPNLGNGEFALQHGGGDYGLKTLAVLLPESDRGILIFTNSENGMVVWKKILEEYFGSIGKELVYKNLN